MLAMQTEKQCGFADAIAETCYQLRLGTFLEKQGQKVADVYLLKKIGVDPFGVVQTLSTGNPVSEIQLGRLNIHRGFA